MNNLSYILFHDGHEPFLSVVIILFYTKFIVRELWTFVGRFRGDKTLNLFGHLLRQIILNLALSKQGLIVFTCSDLLSVRYGHLILIEHHGLKSLVK